MEIKLEIENDYGLFKANNNEEPDCLKIYDSDGEYIEFIDALKFVWSGSKELYLAADDSSSEYVANEIMKALMDDGVNATIFPKADFKSLYKTYGREFVNRIGDCALVIEENQKWKSTKSRCLSR